jgi:hypothetical protein
MARDLRNRRQVDFFNFSFLDILACVIGLLIFVLTIVVVSGGGAAKQATGNRLADSEHDLQDARAAERLAAERRRRAQELLRQRADAAIAPAAAVIAMRDDIQGLRNQIDVFQSLQARARQRLQSIQQQLVSLDQAKSVDPNIALIEQQIRQLDIDAVRLREQAARLTKEKVKAEQISYYLPRVRETTRRPLFVEISGDRIWVLNSEDYIKMPISLTSTTYSRVPGSAGTLVADIVGHPLRADELLERAFPQDTVLTVAVRPNGFAAFRAFRDWAWKREYAVHWVPMKESEPIVLTKANRVFEQ